MEIGSGEVGEGNALKWGGQPAHLGEPHQRRPYAGASNALHAVLLQQRRPGDPQGSPYPWGRAPGRGACSGVAMTGCGRCMARG